jgi:hypothetical protein
MRLTGDAADVDFGLLFPNMLETKYLLPISGDDGFGEEHKNFGVRSCLCFLHATAISGLHVAISSLHPGRRILGLLNTIGGDPPGCFK